MLKYHVAFDSPWYLLLLALVPLMWWFSFRRLAALGPIRRLAAIGLRTAVLVLFIFALADVQMVRISDRLTVIYLLDQSLSIPGDPSRPPDCRRAMIDYVNTEILAQRRGEDRAGVIVFGRDAAIEIPPFDDNVQMSRMIESSLDPEYTNLAAAMRLAQASFPEDAARRIVVVSDGNENLGNALQQAQDLAAGGVGIDVVPVRYRHRGEVVVERVMVPSNIRRGQAFDLKVVITNIRDPKPGDPGEVPGRLKVTKRLGDQSVPVSDEPVKLPPGKRVYSIRQQMDSAGFYTYEAVFEPDRADDDTMRQNNRATAFTHVRGKGQALVIEDSQNPGEHERLIQALRRENMEVTVRPGDNAFGGLDELQQFDTIILANAPREQFSDGQIQMLVRNTQQMGAGLVMLGGPNSFGAGGWANTPLEQAMPVDFQIKSAKVVPQGALVILFHASEMAQGNFWQKVIGEEAIKALGPRDYCGVLHYNGQGPGGCGWLWKPGMCMVGANRDRMLAAVDRMIPGDMPDFDPGLVLAKKGFDSVPTAAVKHMIVISDGDPSDPSRSTVNALINMKVTISTVAVGAHGPAESRRLADLATATGGKYYKATNPQVLPRIFQREARRVAQPLIFNSDVGVRPLVKFPHEMISGVEEPLPLIHGFVLTTRKDNPLVEVSLVSPQPSAERNNTILASWTYGLGKAVAFTTDAGARWTTQWTGWKNYEKLFGQIVRWSMRPSDEEGKFSVATDVQDGQVRVVVSALDKNDEFLNFLDMSASVIRPDLQQLNVKLEQTAPGRYVGTFPGRDSGSYFVTVSPGAGKGAIRTGVNVPYSDEFRVRASNEGLLSQLAELTPKGGSPGKLTDAPEDLADLQPLLAVNHFRHDLPKATSSRDAWHYLALLASCLFFGDVFVRRVHVSFAWLPPLVGRLRDRILRRPAVIAVEETMERLRGRKAEVGGQIEELRASARFEPTEPPSDVEIIEAPLAPPPPKSETPTLAPDQTTEEDSYTARLLRAKKKVWNKPDGEEKNPG